MKQGWITNKYGVKCHYVDDVVRNDDGPSLIYNYGAKHWYKHGSFIEKMGHLLNGQMGLNNGGFMINILELQIPDTLKKNLRSG